MSVRGWRILSYICAVVITEVRGLKGDLNGWQTFFQKIPLDGLLFFLQWNNLRHRNILLNKRNCATGVHVNVSFKLQSISNFSAQYLAVNIRGCYKSLHQVQSAKVNFLHCVLFDIYQCPVLEKTLVFYCCCRRILKVLKLHP